MCSTFARARVRKRCSAEDRSEEPSGRALNLLIQTVQSTTDGHWLGCSVDSARRLNRGLATPRSRNGQTDEQVSKVLGGPDNGF
jgi:hypothetical protein